MERTLFPAHRWRLMLILAGSAVAAWLLRDVLRAIAMQVLAAVILMLLALPLCRRLEKKCAGGISAALSLAVMLLGAGLAVVLLFPPTAEQVEALMASLPALAENLEGSLTRLTDWLQARGIDIAPMRESVLGRLTEAAGSLVSRAVSMAASLIGSLSKVLLSPLMAFYFLRDRRRIAAWLREREVGVTGASISAIEALCTDWRGQGGVAVGRTATGRLEVRRVSGRLALFPAG